MKTKKLLALLMAGAMSVSMLSGCGGSAAKTDDSSADAADTSASAESDMDYVKSISNKAVILSDGTQIPIPHGKYSELKDKFFSYFFRKNQTFLA